MRAVVCPVGFPGLLRRPFLYYLSLHCIVLRGDMTRRLKKAPPTRQRQSASAPKKRDQHAATPATAAAAPHPPSHAPVHLASRQNSSAVGDLSLSAALRPPQQHHLPQQRPPSLHQHLPHHPGAASVARPLSVTHRTSRELIGDNFDADTLLAINAISYATHSQPAAAPPPALTLAAPDAALEQHPPFETAPSLAQHSQPAPPPDSLRVDASNANPAVRLSQILAVAAMDGPTSPAGINPRQRYSDETKESKVLKKKSGFSSLVSSLVGTPRKPTISAPENPVHVTHVGYDQETGEFTVCLYHLPTAVSTDIGLGPSQRMAEDTAGQWHQRAGTEEESPGHH